MTEIARDGLNAPVENWADYGSFWASRLMQTAIESWKAGQTAAQLQSSWRLRWTARSATITASDRLVCGQDTFEIIGVSGDRRSGWIDLVAIAASEEGAVP
ncbi:MAG: head-tail adaptor protein [Porphyrobacter sp.]|nr:head-tail adaptor protein [Porphyrobacter sp.]